MSKNYMNPSLKAYFDKYISKMTIDERYKPYIVDILMRRAYQYQLTPQEIQQDVYTIMSSLVKINISHMENPDYMGLYTPSKHLIELDEDRINKMSPENLYEILTHEVYHALSNDPNLGHDKLGGFNRFTGNWNASLLETIVEKASYKTVFGTDTHNAYYNNNAFGYSDMTFIMDALEAVYGVNEQAILRNGIQGRQQLATFLGAAIGENPKDTLVFLDKLEMHFTRLHRTLYPEDNQSIDNTTRCQEIPRSLADIKKVCMQKLTDRIDNISPSEIDTIDYIAFDFNKLNAIFNERCDYFSEDLVRDDGTQIDIRDFMRNDQALQFATRLTYRQIQQIYALQPFQGKIDPSSFSKVFNYAQIGVLHNYDSVMFSFYSNPTLLKDMGIQVPPFVDLTDSAFNTFSKQRFNEIANMRADVPDFTDTWNNDITTRFYKDLKKIKLTKNFQETFKKFSNFFRRFGKKQLQLPPRKFSRQ